MKLWNWIRRYRRKETKAVPLQEVRPARKVQMGGETFYVRPMRSMFVEGRTNDEMGIKPEYFEMKVPSRQKTVVPGKQILHNEDFD